MSLWGVTRGEHGNIGMSFQMPPQMPPLPESVIRDQFAARVSAEAVVGRDPELPEIAFVRFPAESTGHGGPQVDYLEPVVRRYTEALARPGT